MPANYDNNNNNKLNDLILNLTPENTKEAQQPPK